MTRRRTIRTLLAGVFESAQAIRVMSHRRGKNLDGDGAIEPCVAGFVDLTHPARTKERYDFVRADRLP